MQLRRANNGYLTRLFMPVDKGGFWHRWDVEPRAPQGVAVGVSAEVEVNDGRWLARCPAYEACGGAQLVADGQDRFFCIDCLNEYCGGAWIAVQWPDDPPSIEAELVRRRSPQEMNWRATESVEDLRAENLKHGVD